MPAYFIVAHTSSYHVLQDRLLLDRRRLECAHLLFAALKVCRWYLQELPILQFELGELDKVLLDLVPSYHSVFCNHYAGMLAMYKW